MKTYRNMIVDLQIHITEDKLKHLFRCHAFVKHGCYGLDV